MTTRGIRNNNPGNIDRHDTKWQGMAADQSGDPRFIVFTDAKWGIRAIARLMLTYQNQYGLKTIRGLINRWAPPVENNTTAYVEAVAKDCGVGPDDPVDCEHTSIMLPLVKAIITHENGSQPYGDAALLEGIHLAGVADAPEPPAPEPVVVVAPAPPPKPLVKQGTFVTKVGAVAAVAASGCTTYAPTVKGWADQLAAFTGSPIIAHAQTALLTVAGGLLVASIVFSVLKQKAAKQ